jgi:hypothetical protein
MEGRMGMTSKRRPPAYGPPADKAEDGDIAVPEREGDREHRGARPGRIERRDWRGEGVVGNYHTD